MIATDIEQAQTSREQADTSATPRRANRLVAELLRNASVVGGAGALGMLAIISIAAPLVAGHNPDAWNPNALNQYPTASHWFGTDYLGRDLFARVVYGGRISLLAGLGVLAIGAGIGVPLGLIAGYIGGILDDVFMRLMDIILSFPGIVLAILVVGILAPGLTSAVIAIGIGSIPFFARFIRGSTLSIKEHDYVLAARVLGTRNLRIVRRHILPNALGPLVVLCATTYAYAILGTAALSFLGVGSQPPTSDWGVLLTQGNQYMFVCATELIFPGLAILVTIMASNVLGDGLSHVLNRRA